MIAFPAFGGVQEDPESGWPEIVVDGNAYMGAVKDSWTRLSGDRENHVDARKWTTGQEYSAQSVI